MPAATHDPLFDSAWLKWAWAIFHAQTLEHDIAAWSEQNPNPVRAVRADYYPKRHGFALIITEIDPIPVRWQLLLGDIANNYRAALDHLAWALVTRGRTPPDSGLLTRAQEKAVYFPLCKDRRVFNAQIRLPPTPKSLLKLPGIRRADAAIVRRAQPYHRGPTKRPMDPFLLLASINTRDKHRAIHPVWAYPKRVEPVLLAASEHPRTWCRVGRAAARTHLARCAAVGRRVPTDEHDSSGVAPRFAKRFANAGAALAVGGKISRAMRYRPKNRLSNARRRLALRGFANPS